MKITDKGFNAFTLKLAAVIGMISQHSVIVFGDMIPAGLRYPMYGAGGLTFPVMAFLLVEGFKRTSDIKKYAMRLFIFAVVSQYPFSLVFGGYGLRLNIMFTLFFGLLVLILHEKCCENKKWLFWIGSLAYVAGSIYMDWDIIGPVMILLYCLIKKEEKRRVLPGVIAGSMFIVMAAAESISASPVETSIERLAFGMGVFVSTLILLRNYNGQRGIGMKYFFYAVYPAHLLILGLLRLL